MNNLDREHFIRLIGADHYKRKTRPCKDEQSEVVDVPKDTNKYNTLPVEEVKKLWKNNL